MHKKSTPLVVAGLAPIGLGATLLVLAAAENHLPLDWQARLHMSLPPEARVVRCEADMDGMEVVFRLPDGNADGFDAKAFRSVWEKNVGSYAYPCPGSEGSDMLATEAACAWGGRDPDGGKGSSFLVVERVLTATAPVEIAAMAPEHNQGPRRKIHRGPDESFGRPVR